MEDPKFYRKHDLAGMVGMSRSSIVYGIQKGVIPEGDVKVGNLTLYSEGLVQQIKEYYLSAPRYSRRNANISDTNTKKESN